MKKNIDFSIITRIEVIDQGVERLFVCYRDVLCTDVQDEGRTLKIFVDKRKKQNVLGKNL